MSQFYHVYVRYSLFKANKKKRMIVPSARVFHWNEVSLTVLASKGVLGLDFELLI